MRRCMLRCLGATRPLTPTTLLETVRGDPGMTATYYANRYFGREQLMRVNHMLWNELKRFGKVTCSRGDEAVSSSSDNVTAATSNHSSDRAATVTRTTAAGAGADHAPRWYATFARQRVHHVRRHNADEEDLSVLRGVHDVRDDVDDFGSYSNNDNNDRSSSAAASWPAAATVAPHNALFGSGGSSVGGSADARTTPASVTPDDVDKAVVLAVQSMPGKAIQFYVHELPLHMQPHAPAAFRRLREAGLLTREATAQGTFIWR